LPRFQVLLTNYEIFVSDKEIFQKIAFQHIIMDEAHKMKNSKSKIAETLKLLPCPRILLLTGTPVQNNTT
jgi:SNF2 family DNA or RNA helicase